MAGAPTVQETVSFGDKVRNSIKSPYMWGSIAKGETKEETLLLNSNLYPYRPLPSDKFDSEWAIRQDLAEQGSGMISPSRPMPWTEHEINYLKKKRDAEEYASFQDWISHKFPMNDPANREILKRVVPSYFSTRAAVLNEQIDVTAKYAKLRLTGPENEDDLMFQYLVESGRIQLPRGPLWDPMDWMHNQYGIPSDATNEAIMESVQLGNKKAYEKGLFNPFKPTTPSSNPLAANPYNMVDIMGDRRVNWRGPLGTIQPVSKNWANTYGGSDFGFTNRINGQTPGAREGNVVKANQGVLPSVGAKALYSANFTEVNRGEETYSARWNNPDRRYVPKGNPYYGAAGGGL